MIVLLRLTGVSLLVVSLFHVFLWRRFRWGEEIRRLSAINARVFVVHTLFVVFVLVALGLLSALRPDLLLAPSELARLLLLAVVAFWVLRLALQPLVFDGALVDAARVPLFLRAGASLLWGGYVVVYGLALLKQWPH